MKDEDNRPIEGILIAVLISLCFFGLLFWMWKGGF